MRSNKFFLGNGFKSVQGIGVGSIILSHKADNVFKKSPPDPKFTFNANFCESNSQLRKELNESFGASNNFGMVSFEVQAIYNKVATNSNNASYCVITLQWEKYRKNVDLSDANNFKDFALELNNPEECYKFFGDNMITEVVYGEKLLVIIQIDKNNHAMNLDQGVSAKVKAPYVGGKISLEKILNQSHSSSISNLHIYSVGNNTPNQQTAVISDVNVIKAQIENLINRDPHRGSHHANEIEELKKFFNKKIAAINNEIRENPPQNTKKLLSTTEFIEKKMKKCCSQQINNDSENNYAVISFTVSSYSYLIKEKYQTSANYETIKAKYEHLLYCTARASNYVKALKKCQSRARLYLDHIDYAIKNESVMNIN